MTGIVKTSMERNSPQNTSSNARSTSNSKQFFPAIYNQGMKYESVNPLTTTCRSKTKERSHNQLLTNSPRIQTDLLTVKQRADLASKSKK